MSALLRFTDVAAGYGGEAVVSGVGLTVAAGEVLGLVGPNGAGKSTLLRAVVGESELLGGSIEVAGQPLAELSVRERARTVAVMPQQVIATFSFAAEEFVAFGRHAHVPRFSAPSPSDITAIERAMELTDTADLAGRPVDALSGGDLQRLAFAQAIAQEPKVLLLDEPISHLDLNHRLQILDLVRDLADEGIGVLAVFHDLDLAARYSDRVAVVARGGVSSAKPPAEVITAEKVHEVFGVRAVVRTDPVTGSVCVTPVLRDGAVAAEQRGSVLVVGGSGVAAPLLRRLVIAGWHVTAAALNAGDADAALAEALGLEYVPIPPFAPMDEAARDRVAALAAVAEVVVVCDVPFGHGNVDNLVAVAASGRPLVLVGDIEGRDYTGGRAAELWRSAVASGAVVVSSADGVEAALGGVVLR